MRTLRRAQRPIVTVVQRVLLRSLLFLVYYIGFGIGRAVLSVAGRRLLHDRPRRALAPDTGWREAEGYGLDEASLRRQS